MNNEFDEFNEFNTAITRAVENAALHGLTFVDRPERWFIAIPPYIQRVMLRHYRRHNMTPSGEIAGSNSVSMFTEFFGMKVVPGYEMKIVVYHPDAAVYHNPNGDQPDRPQLYESPITIDRSVPGRITIVAGNETINLSEP